MSMKIKLENAKVIGHNLTGSGYTVEVKVPGQDWGRKFTCWSSDRPTMLSTITISGELSWKMREYTNQQGETKWTVDMNINEPTYQITAQANPAPAPDLTDQVPF